MLTAGFLAVQVAGIVGVVTWIAVVPLLLATRWIGLIQHNQVHVPLFRGHVTNVIFGSVLYLAEGVPTCLYWVHHVTIHHRFINSPRDWTGPFSFSGATFPTHPVSRVRYVLTFIPRAWRKAPGILWSRYPRKRVDLVTELAIGVAVALMGGLFGSWESILFFLGVPWAAVAIALPLTNWRHHQGADYADRYRVARVNNGFFSARIGFYIGYHSAHHARPALHWSRLAEFHEREFALYIPSSYIVGSVVRPRRRGLGIGDRMTGGA